MITDPVELTALSIWMLATISTCVYSLNYYLLFWLNRKRMASSPDNITMKLPTVSVHIPVYNEAEVIEETLEACLNLDYPKSLLEIVVVDDSTDETTEKVKRYVERYPSLIKLIHRDERRGYKAGALQEALENSRGEFILVLDAGSIPSRDFLKKAVKHFYRDEKIAFVQGRLKYKNDSESWITKAVSIIYEFYRVFTQSSLYKGGLFVASVGNAVVYRRSALEAVGGWSWDTLAEDLDISYRLQISGWVGVFAEDAVCRDDVPSSLQVFRTQYNRHIKGPIQNFKKHIVPLLSNPKITVFKKVEAVLQLSAPLAFLVGQISLSTGVLFHLLAPPEDVTYLWQSPVGAFLSAFFTLSFIAPFVVYVRILRINKLNKLRYLAAVVFILTDYLLMGTKSIVELLFKRKNVWVRTAKTVSQRDRIKPSSNLIENDYSDTFLRVFFSLTMLALVFVIAEKGLIAYSLGFLLPPLCWLMSTIIEKT
ncbi:glycosyltransferase [Candidatus Bathyarchaeota archaeon]|nr:glycosyltransferase [Candidatus Bathyarchaeota archaeon]